MADKVERHDLLSCLLEANDLDLNLEILSENEIISMLHILHTLIMLTYELTSQAIFTSSLLLDMKFVTCASFGIFDSDIN